MLLLKRGYCRVRLVTDLWESSCGLELLLWYCKLWLSSLGTGYRFYEGIEVLQGTVVNGGQISRYSRNRPSAGFTTNLRKCCGLILMPRSLNWTRMMWWIRWVFLQGCLPTFAQIRLAACCLFIPPPPLNPPAGHFGLIEKVMWSSFSLDCYWVSTFESEAPLSTRAVSKRPPPKFAHSLIGQNAYAFWILPTIVFSFD